MRKRSTFGRLGGGGAQDLGGVGEGQEAPRKARTRGERPVWTGLALLVAGAFFMENLDGTIIATAAPRMARSFGVPSVELNVVITAYLLALGVFIPVSGWIADRFGARLVFSGAIALFTVSSGLCALSANLGELTVARVLQGMGGAMMVPVGRLVVLRAARKADIIRVIAYLTWPALVAPVVAPALGGALVTYASWRWIFVLNLPLGLIALYIAVRIVPDLRPDRAERLDWLGFALTGAGLGAFVYGLELVTDGNVSWASAGAAVGVGAMLIWWAVGHLRRSAHPLLDLRVLRVPTFRASSLGGSLFRMAISAAPFLLALMFQNGFGWSPLRSGMLVIGVFVGNIAIKPFTTPILHRFGFRTVLMTAAAAAGLTLAVCREFLRRDSARADRARSRGKWGLPVDRLHGLQHDRLRRRGAGGNGQCQHALEHDPAADHGSRRGIGSPRHSCRHSARPSGRCLQHRERALRRGLPPACCSGFPCSRRGRAACPRCRFGDCRRTAS